MRADKVVLGKTARYGNNRNRYRLPATGRGLIRVGIIGIGKANRTSRCFGSRYLLCEINEHRAQMFTVANKVLGSAGSGEQKSEDVLVGLLHVASRAGEHEVVAPIISALSFSRCHVIESDTLFAYATTAVRANWSVPIEEPFARVGIRVPARRQRRALMSRTLDSFSRTTTGTHSSVFIE